MFVPLFVTKAYRGSGGIAALLVNLDFKWSRVVSLMPLLLYCLLPLAPGKEPWHPLNRKLNGPQNWSGSF